MRQICLKAHGWRLLSIELIKSLRNLFYALEPLLLFEKRFTPKVVFFDVTKLQKQTGVIELIGVTAISKN